MAYSLNFGRLASGPDFNYFTNVSGGEDAMKPFIRSISSKVITKRRKIIKCWSLGKSRSCGASNGACWELMAATNVVLLADEWRASSYPKAAEERIVTWI